MRILSIDCGIKNLAYCVLECDQDSFKIVEWNILNVQGGDFYTTSQQLVDVLVDTFVTSDDPFDFVLIENQPVIKNPVMKSIQVVIYTFFLMMSKQQGNETEIKLMSASNKLKVKHKPPTLTQDTGPTTKNKYQENKKLSIAYTKHYLRDDETWLTRFMQEKKKDDLADSFLQGVFFIEKFVLTNK